VPHDGAAVASVPADGRASPGRCRNCGAVAVGRFCPACGQATALHPPTVGEFVHEFLGHHVAIDGSLWRTLAALLLHPGLLTTEYFAGRRARFIAPLRLYLTFSLILFAVSGWSGGNLRFGNEAVEFRLPAEAAKEADHGKVVFGPNASTMMRTGIKVVDDRIAHIEAMTYAQRNERLASGMRACLPYVLIVLVPVLALFLKLVYWNRHRLYGEHLVVAFHAQAAAFIFALLSAIPLGDWFGSLIAIVVAVQGYLALRRVYGGRRWPTLLREGLLFGVYGTTVLFALAITATLTLAL
jgi:hypothetical protein